MCNVIYLAALGLLLMYADSLVGQYSLAVATGREGTMAVAVGWEMAWELWPLIALGAVAGSALTFVATRWAAKRRGGAGT